MDVFLDVGNTDSQESKHVAVYFTKKESAVTSWLVVPSLIRQLWQLWGQLPCQTNCLVHQILSTSPAEKWVQPLSVEETSWNSICLSMSNCQNQWQRCSFLYMFFGSGISTCKTANLPNLTPPPIPSLYLLNYSFLTKTYKNDGLDSTIDSSDFNSSYQRNA